MSIEKVLAGAVDMHCHGYPEISLGLKSRQDNRSLISSLSAAGMGGVVLKSHFWPTVSQTYYLDQECPDCRVFGSITLNNINGGISPLAVQAAALLGAKEVFFPTWSARNDRNKKRFWARVAALFPAYAEDDVPITLLDEDGNLEINSIKVLDLAKQHDLIVFTGHITVPESMALIREGVVKGVKVVFSHPNSGSVGAKPDEILAAAKMGAYIEFACMTILSLRNKVNIFELADLIREIGPEKVIITSDAFEDWVPPAPEMLRMFAGMLLQAGLDDNAIRQMVYFNPRKLLSMSLV